MMGSYLGCERNQIWVKPSATSQLFISDGDEPRPKFDITTITNPDSG